MSVTVQEECENQWLMKTMKTMKMTTTHCNGRRQRTDHPVDHHRVPVAPVLHGVVDINKTGEELEGSAENGLIAIERDQQGGCNVGEAGKER
jgi:hypothetical protein